MNKNLILAYQLIKEMSNEDRMMTAAILSMGADENADAKKYEFVDIKPLTDRLKKFRPFFLGINTGVMVSAILNIIYIKSSWISFATFFLIQFCLAYIIADVIVTKNAFSFWKKVMAISAKQVAEMKADLEDKTKDLEKTIAPDD